MNIPPFVLSEDYSSYLEELIQTLIDGLSNNGWTTPPITKDDLINTKITWPDGTVEALADHMPNGTIWYVTNTDTGIPNYVGKIDGVLKKFDMSNYP